MSEFTSIQGTGMTNAIAAPSLEEKLVQHIKASGLSILVDDQAAIEELTRRAIQEALIRPRPKLDRYGSYSSQTTTLAVDAADEISKAAIKSLVDSEVKRMTADPETMVLVSKAIVSQLPDAVEGAVRGLVTDLRLQMQNETRTALNTISQRLGIPI